MEKLSRILTVVVTVAALAFMGFAGVIWFGGPNWEAEARRLEGYTFNQAEGEPPIWSATRAEGREELSTRSPLLPAVLTAAIQDRTRRAQEEHARLAQAIPQLQQQAEILTRMQAQDLEALERAYEGERQRLAAFQTQIEAASKQQEAIAEDIRKLEDQLDSRRQDVFRLDLEYRLLLADLGRIEQNVEAVSQQIRLIEDELEKVQRRQQEFDARGLPPLSPAESEALRARLGIILRSLPPPGETSSVGRPGSPQVADNTGL